MRLRWRERILLIFASIFMLALYIGLFAGAGRFMFRWLDTAFPGLRPVAFGAVFACLVLLILAAFMASRAPDSPLPRVILRGAHYALGVLIYVMLSVYGVALVLFLGRLVGLVSSPEPQAVTLTGAAVCLVLAAALSGYGIVHGGTIKTARYTVDLAPRGRADSFRIALISDIHMGYAVEEKHLGKIVAAVNALEPDVVCIAGDIFDGDTTALSDPEGLKALFREMSATYGVYACLGNHDAGSTHDRMIDFLQDAGVRLLQDEAEVVGDRLVIVGRKDATPIGGQGSGRGTMANLPGGGQLPVVVLDHQPGNIGEYGEETDLILCGHTHRGQMFPMNLFTKFFFRPDYGYYRKGDTGPQAVVTSGAGMWGPPMRVGSDSEVAEIQVRVPQK